MKTPEEHGGTVQGVRNIGLSGIIGLVPPSRICTPETVRAKRHGLGGIVEVG